MTNTLLNLIVQYKADTLTPTSNNESTEALQARVERIKGAHIKILELLGTIVTTPPPEPDVLTIEEIEEIVKNHLSISVDEEGDTPSYNPETGVFIIPKDKNNYPTSLSYNNNILTLELHERAPLSVEIGTSINQHPITISAGQGIYIKENYTQSSGYSWKIHSTITQYTDKMARASLSSRHPIEYDPDTGIIRHAIIDNVEGTYNTVTVNQWGHVIKGENLDYGGTADGVITINAGDGISITGTPSQNLSDSPVWTINNTLIQYTDEMAQDTVASMIQNGTGIMWNYDDVNNMLTPTISLSPFSTTDLSEGSNLYYTDVRVRGAISLTTTGSSGASTYNSTTGVLNIPIYTDTNRYVSGASVTGTNAKTLTLTFNDGSTPVTAAWTDLVGEVGQGDGNDFTTSAAFSNGVITFTRTDGGTYNVNLDGRYLTSYEDNYVDSVAFNSTSRILTLGRTNALADLTVTIPDENKYVTSAAFSGTSSKLLTLTFNDASTVTASFTDIDTNTDNYVDAVSFDATSRLLTLGRTGILSDLTASIPDNYTTSGSFNTSTGNLTYTRNDGGTYVVNLDGRYLTVDNDNYVDSLAFNTGTRVLTVGRTGVLADLTITIPDNNKFVTGLVFTGTTTKTLTATFNDATTTTATFADLNYYTTEGTFNAATGNLVYTRTDGGTYTVNLDGRYLTSYEDNYVDSAVFNTDTRVLTLGRTGALSDLTVSIPDSNDYVDSVSFNNTTRILTIGRTGVLSDLTATIPDANKFVTSLAFSGTTTKTLTLTFNDSSTIFGTFTDLSGGGGTADGNDYTTSGTFNTSTGNLTHTRTDGGTYTVNLDGRYLPIGKTATINAGTGISISQTATQNITDNPSWTIVNTITQYTDSMARAAISAITPVLYNNTTGVISHALSGVTANTYNNVTVNTFGHVTSGSNVAYLSDISHVHGIASNSGVQQFTYGVNDNVRFTGEGLSVVTFDSATKKVVITTNYTETDPVALAKTITLLQGTGISITGTATQALSTNPSWTINSSVTQYTDPMARAAISALSPISYNSTTGVISHTTSGVTSGTYNSFTVDVYGHITAASIATYNNYFTTSAAFDTSNGIITYTRNDGGTYTVDIDGRYLQSFTETDPVALAKTITINAGTGITISQTPTQALSINPSWTIASSITQYTDAMARGAISLTTTGTSGLSTYNSTTGVLNIPNYQNYYTTSGVFNTSTGIITFTRTDGGTYTTDINGKYLTSFAFTDGNGFDGTVTGTTTPTLALTTTLQKGSVVFINNTTGGVGEDNPNLFWDDTNNRLGVKTNASPQFPLHVNSSGAISNSLPSVATGSFFQVTGGAFTNTVQTPVTAIWGSLDINTTGTQSLLNDVGIYAGVVGTVSVYNATGSNVIGAVIAGLEGGVNVGNGSTIEYAAAIHAKAVRQINGQSAFSGTITNYYLAFLQDLSTTNISTSRITNRWGLYQEGELDKNFFAGTIRATQYGVGTHLTSSPAYLIGVDSSGNFKEVAPSAPVSGSVNYIWNTLTQQPSSNIHISNAAVIGTNLTVGGTSTFTSLSDGTGVARMAVLVNGVLSTQNVPAGTYIEAGTNMTRTGSGTASDPYYFNASVGSAGLSSAYVSVTDGTTVAAAANGDTLKFRSANNLLNVTVGSNDATHGDNVLYTFNQSNITGVGTLVSGVWNGTAITNSYLANSSITIGTTVISLGGTTTSLAGLTSVTSTSFIGDLTGNATTATLAANSTLWSGYPIEAVVYSSGTIQLPVWNSTVGKFQFANDPSIQTWLNLGSAAYTSSGDYVKNQTSIQASSNFNISGAGVIGTSLTVGASGAFGSNIIQENSVADNLQHWIRNNSSSSSGYARLLLNALGNSWGLGMGSMANNGNTFEIKDDAVNGGTTRLKIETGTGKVTLTNNLLIGGTTDFTDNTLIPLYKSHNFYTADFGMGTPDANGLQIFAGANDKIRFGKRVSGVFTEWMRLYTNTGELELYNIPASTSSDVLVSNAGVISKHDRTASTFSIGGNSATVTTINGKLINGTNTSISGAGTAASPYAVNVTFPTSYTHPNSGVTAGTYNNVTVDIQGHVTSGTNAAYLLANQSITWTGSGDVSGSASGTTSLTPTLTLATVNSDIGTFNTLTVNAKGLVTAATNTSYAPVSQSGNYIWNQESVLQIANFRIGYGIFEGNEQGVRINGLEGKPVMYLQRSGVTKAYIGVHDASVSGYITGLTNHDLFIRSEGAFLLSTGGSTMRFKISSTGVPEFSGLNDSTGVAKMVVTTNGVLSYQTIPASGTNYTHPDIGTPGTYKSVTVNAQGHVTAGTSPTTLAGYGITDAAASTHNHSLDNLLNVSITGKATGDLLKWNGTAWINFVPTYTSNTGTVTSVSGTANRITVTGGNAAIVDIHSNYSGQSTITTLGTIASGVWQGTAITDTYISSANIWNAKMNNPMTTAGDIIIGGTSGVPTRLAKGADGQVLKIVSGALTWSTDNTGSGGDGNTFVTSAAFNTTTGVLTLGRNDAVNVTVDLDGKYAEANHSHTITLSGDISGTGTTEITTTIGSNRVILPMMAQISTSSFLGRSTPGTGNVQVLSVSNVQNMLNLGSAAYVATTTFALSEHNHTLDSLSNVTIGTKETNHYLGWNGSAWVNRQIAYSEISGTPAIVTWDTLTLKPTYLSYFAEPANGGIRINKGVSGTPTLSNTTLQLRTLGTDKVAISFYREGHSSANMWHEATGYIDTDSDIRVGGTLVVKNQAYSAATTPWILNISGNAATVTNGVYTNQLYDNPTWLNTLAAGKITGLHAVATSGNYNDLINKPTIPSISATQATAAVDVDGYVDLTINGVTYRLARVSTPIT